jgi:hypothetical protein
MTVLRMRERSALAGRLLRTPPTFRPARSTRSVEGRVRHLVRVTVLTTFYRRMLLFAYRLEGREIPSRGGPAGCEFARLREADVPHYLALRPDQSEAEIRWRISAGHACYVAWHEGSIIDAGWSASGRVHVPYLGRDVRFSEGDVYNYDAYTAAGARGRGLYMAHNAFVARCHQQEGFARSVALVAAENDAVVKMLSRSGLVVEGRYVRLGVGSASLVWGRPEEGCVLPAILAPRRTAA